LKKSSFPKITHLIYFLFHKFGESLVSAEFTAVPCMYDMNAQQIHVGNDRQCVECKVQELDVSLDTEKAIIMFPHN
jgi:hypothetical protein